MATLSASRIQDTRAEYMSGRSNDHKPTVRLKGELTDDFVALDSALDSITLRLGLPADEQDDMLFYLVQERRKVNR